MGDHALPLGAAAVPTLIEMLNERDDYKARYFAAQCICTIGEPARETVPVLIAILREQPQGEHSDELEWITVHALASIGPAAKAAVPLVEKLVEQAKPPTRSPTSSALLRRNSTTA